MSPISPRSIFQTFRASFVLLHYVSLLFEVVLVNNMGQHFHFPSISIAPFIFPILSQDQALDQAYPYSKEIIN